MRQYFKKELWKAYKGEKHDPSYVSLSKEPLMPLHQTYVFYKMPPGLQKTHQRQILKISESGLENLWIIWVEYRNKLNATIYLSSR